MKKNHTQLVISLGVIGCLFSTYALADLPPSMVDFPAFTTLVKEVEPYRAKRLLSVSEFTTQAKEPNTVILDTRSLKMYNQKHIKGAIHLNFSDFTQENLARLIPNKETKILIYCNNNFSDDEVSFPTKVYIPPKGIDQKKPMTLALNIPTYINLYGYGYRNIYELADLVPTRGSFFEFEGTEVLRLPER